MFRLPQCFIVYLSLKVERFVAFATQSYFDQYVIMCRCSLEGVTVIHIGA